METSAIASDSLNKRVPILIFVTPLLGILGAFLLGHMRLSPAYILLVQLSPWLSALLTSIIVWRLYRIIKIKTGSKKWVFLPYLVFAPNFFATFFLGLLNDKSLLQDASFWFFLISQGIHLAMLLVINIVYLLTTKTYLPFQGSRKEEAAEAESPFDILGKGDSTIDKVIGSILLRAHSASRMIVVTLFLMVALVLIGGGASIGTVVLDESEKVRNLEVARRDFVETISMIDTTTAYGKELQIKSIQAVLKKWGNNDKYEELIKSTLDKNQISWEDIAMRATIAALTLFLVQIFFHIYKYNQQQESHLLAKAELLELFKDTTAHNDALRKGMLEKMDSNGAFGKGPASPVDQIINVMMNEKKKT